MTSIDELEIFNSYIRLKKLKHSNQREIILETFLRSNRHITAEELYDIIKVDNPHIGTATVYRTLKLLCESGLCQELRLEDGRTRYEPLFGQEHHDHIICMKCGKFVEIISPEIEKIQEKLAKKNGFILKSHRLNLFGLCKACVRSDGKVEQ